MIRAEKRRHIMNLLDQFEVLEIDKNMLTDKKQQTDYKIKYVSEYAKLWSIISAERNDVTEITFIDCMCNAGVYRDGDCCTAIEVFSLFKEAAQLHKNKTYNLYLNDIDSNRISCINKVIQYLNDDVVENLKVYTNNMDVNVYLERLATNDNIFGYGKSVVLYIDPFDFGTVNIPIVSKVLKNNYCEVIFNFFISDYVRNIKKDKNRIRACINNGNVETKEEIIIYAKKLQEKGAQNVLISLGGDGAILLTEKNEIYYSNENRRTSYPEYVTVQMTADKEGEEVKPDEIITYKVTIKNPSKIRTYIEVEDILPEDVKGIELNYNRYVLENDNAEETQYDIEAEANIKYTIENQKRDLLNENLTDR